MAQIDCKECGKQGSKKGGTKLKKVNLYIFVMIILFTLIGANLAPNSTFAATTSIQTLQKTVSVLKKEIVSLKEKILKNDTEIKALKKGTTDKEAEIKRLKAELSVKNKENETKEKKIKQLKDKLVKYEGPSNPAPPYYGTVFLDPDIINENDPTSFIGLNYIGKGKRTMYDYRVEDWIETEAFLFKAQYDDGYTIEIQVNPEFNSIEKAQFQASRFAGPIGRLPTTLRSKLETVWIHMGDKSFGGGNNNILIHTERADQYISEGILEEALVHEGTHTSMDPSYADSDEWKEAQYLDDNFISTYAKEFPNREDLAETYLLYFALKYRSDRLSSDLINTIEKTIPNRIHFFDQLKLEMHPIK